MSLLRTVSLCVIALLLGACAASPYGGADAAARSSILEVLRPLRTEPGWARAFLQHGRLVGYGFNRYHPFCYLELNTVREQAQEIAPGRFEIRRVQRYHEEVVQRGPLRHAGLRFVDNGLSDQTQLLVFTLHSEQQPGVRALVCGGAFDAPSLAAAPTPVQIAETLGDYARLQ